MNKIKDILKILIISILIVLAVLLLSRISYAGNEPVKTGKEETINNPTADSIDDLISDHGTLNPGQQNVDDKNVFLSTGEFVKQKGPFTSLFCSGHGIRLTAAHSPTGQKDYSSKLFVGYIKAGNDEYTKDDSGRELSLLYGDDVYLTSATTVGKGDDKNTISITETTKKGENDSKAVAAEEALEKAKEIWGDTPKTITYGYYKIGKTEKATPAEAYVLQFMRDNTSRSSYVQVAWWDANKNSASSAGTSIDAIENPNGEEDEEEIHEDLDGDGIPDDWSEEEFNESEDPYEENPETKKTGNDLYEEAMAFQGYILALTDGDAKKGKDMKTKYSGDVFDLDYTKTMEPIDTSDVDVLFDSKTNTYRIGPFNMEYVRAGAQYGDRDVVDFAGITGATLKVKDLEGTTTEMKLEKETYTGTKGWRIVYDHEREMRYYDTFDPEDDLVGTKQVTKTKEVIGADGNKTIVKEVVEEEFPDKIWYPYPYAGENFYIEVDYKDNLASVEEIKFDFHWMNAGAEYQDLKEGYAYAVTWEVFVEYKETTAHEDGSCSQHSRACTCSCAGTDTCHGSHSYTKTSCHTHQHESYTFEFDSYIQYKSHETLTSQPFINCLKAKVIDFDPSGGIDGDSVSGAKAVYMTAGGWDLTTELGGFVWVEGIKYEKGAIVNDPDEDGVSKWVEPTGLEEYKEKEDWRKENVEVRLMKVLYNKNGDTYTEVKRELAKAWKTKTTADDGTVTLTDEYDWREKKLYTDSNGEYEMQVLVPSFEDKTEEQVVSYDIEFIYDGQKYEVVELLVSAEADTIEEKLQNLKEAVESGDVSAYKDDSYVIESDSLSATNEPVAEGRNTIPLGRLNFNNNFYEIYGEEDSAIQDDKSTKGYAKNPFEAEITNPDLGMENPMILEYEGKTYYEHLEEIGSSEPDNVTLSNENSRIVTKLETEDENGFVDEKYQLASRTSTGSLLYPLTDRIYIRHYTDNTADEELTSSTQLLDDSGVTLDGEETTYYPIYGFFHQINLGLVKREEVDVSVAKDLYKSTVVINQQQLTYKYSTLKDYENEDSEDAEYLNQLIEIQSLKQEYEMGLYAADFYYRSSVYSDAGTTTGDIIASWKDDSELRMFATYKILLYNDSQYGDVTINRMDDYYDSSFTLVTEDIRSGIVDSEGKKIDQIVAEQPYYRVYSLLNSNLEDGIYYYNSEDDLAAEGLERSGDNSRAVVREKIEASAWNIDDTTYGTNDEYKRTQLDMFKYTNGSDVNYVDDTNDLVLSPGERIEIFVTYEIDRDGFLTASGGAGVVSENYDKVQEELKETREKLLGGKNNVVEVGNFSSFYTEKSLRYPTAAYTAGQIMGKSDDDSAPGNINLNKTIEVNGDSEDESRTYTTLDKTWFDDDIDSAPIYKIYLRAGDDSKRQTNGTTWIDSPTEDTGFDSATGNGIFDTGESGVEGITVTLVEKVRAPEQGSSDTDNLLEYEFVWPEVEAMPEYKSITQTAEGGNYSFINFPAGIYVVRFEYGNTEATMEFNGQDYENTAYQIGMLNNATTSEELVENCDTLYLAGEPTLNNEWHDLGNNDSANTLNETRVSDARDYEPQRLRVIAYSRTINNAIAEVLDGDDSSKEELMQATSMIANTAKLNCEIEKMSEIDYSKYNGESDQKIKFIKGVSKTEVEDSDTQTELHEYKIPNIDFGIEERAKTSIKLDKYLKTILLTKEENSAVILKVDIEDDETMILASEDSIGAPKILGVTESDGIQGFKYITMESEFFENLTVTLTYRIDVLNESEVDWTSELLTTKYVPDDLRNHADEIEGTHEPGGNHTALVTGEGITYGTNVGYYYYTNEIIDGTTKDYKIAKASETDETVAATVTYTDKVVRTTVDQLVDYVDNDIELAEISKNLERDNAWTTDVNEAVTDHSSRVWRLEGLISEDSYTIADANSDGVADKFYLQDDEGNIYVTETKSNIALSTSDTIERKIREYDVYVRDEKGARKVDTTGWGFVKTLNGNTKAYGYRAGTNGLNVHNVSLTKQLMPLSYINNSGAEAVEKGNMGDIFITTSVSVTSMDNAADMNYNNLSEVLVYSNPVGRRTFMTADAKTIAGETAGSADIVATIPGNANEIAKEHGIWNAAHTSNGPYKASGVSLAEVDSDAPEYVTFTEPTGIKQVDAMKAQYLMFTLGIMSIIGIAIVGFTVKIAIDKRKLSREDN